MVTLYLLSRSGNRLENLYLINHLWWQKPCCWCWSEALPRRGILSHLSRTHDHKLHEKQDFLVATAIQADEIQEALETVLLLVLFSVCTGKLAGRREAEHGGAKAASTVAVLVFSRCQTSDCATRISHMSNIILVFGDTFFLSPRHRGKSMNWTR